MRVLTELESHNEKFLKERGIHFAMVLMTENIISHHIFDATQSIDRFLREEGIHDFNSQCGGEKTYISTHLLTFKRELIINTSVYKAAKRGDKRMWFGSEILPTTSPNDIYIMMAKACELFILNMSHIDIMACLTTGIDNPIKQFLLNISCHNQLDKIELTE